VTDVVSRLQLEPQNLSAVDARTRVKNQVEGCGSGRVGDQEKAKKSTHPTASGPPPPQDGNRFKTRFEVQFRITG
jgi:hypothetical protein